MQVLLIALGISIFINFAAFIIAYKKQTDHLTDATYSITFIAIAAHFFYWYSQYTLADIILLTMICFWAIRLGGYLFTRIRSMGSDARFDQMRPHWNRYIKFWILQAISVWVISIPIVMGLTSDSIQDGLSTVQIVGCIIWLIGFVIESVADFQKSKFKNQPESKGAFMQTGLYSVVQYPNYLGEILVWIGIYVYVFPSLQGLAHVSIISPLWIITLLLFISGIPLLKKSTKAKYGHLPDYKKYVKDTKELIPYIY